MPSTRPCAAFEPLPPSIDISALVDETANFEYVTRISREMINEDNMTSFEELILRHVILGGKPLVVEGFQYYLDEKTFTSAWLRDNYGTKVEDARDLAQQNSTRLTIGHYLNNMAKYAIPQEGSSYRDRCRRRLYLKDIDCPTLWRDKLEDVVPSLIFHMNEAAIASDGASVPSSGFIGGATNSPLVKAGDLMSSLPVDMRADNLMCYIGHEGTYTPAHREMCASLGQNIMVEASTIIDEDGTLTEPGSSVWFMTETKDRHLVSEYWLSRLGHDIEVEKHFAQVNAWRAAPFTTFIVEQRVGDLILIPPLAPHQVWNRGTRTMKVAWNRTTVETLELALHEALPRARMVCRDEQYKNKAIVYFTLQKYSSLFDVVERLLQSTNDDGLSQILQYDSKIKQLQKDFRKLLSLFTEILISECPNDPGEEVEMQYLSYDGFVTCSFCRGNIFNRFLTCPRCKELLINGEENTYDICMECFTMGRSCACLSDFDWIEQFPWSDLLEKHEVWRQQVISFEGGLHEKSPKSLPDEIKVLAGKKTVAQICIEQLGIRPRKEPTIAKMTCSRTRQHKADTNGTNGHHRPGRLRVKGKFKRIENLEEGFVIEHVSNHARESWKCATCSKCGKAYQYGSLWRMFDMMPQDVMECVEWKCPACKKICSCGACFRRPGFKPYEPRGIVLGHDTRQYADPRSVECLVDFSHSNLHHLKKVGDDDPIANKRIDRRIKEAAQARSNSATLGDEDADGEPLTEENQYFENGIRFEIGSEIPIDPLLHESIPLVEADVSRQPNGTSRGRCGRQGSEAGEKKASAKRHATSKTKQSSQRDMPAYIKHEYAEDPAHC